MVITKVTFLVIPIQGHYWHCKYPRTGCGFPVCYNQKKVPVLTCYYDRYKPSSMACKPSYNWETPHGTHGWWWCPCCAKKSTQPWTAAATWCSPTVTGSVAWLDPLIRLRPRPVLSSSKAVGTLSQWSWCDHRWLLTIVVVNGWYCLVWWLVVNIG